MKFLAVEMHCDPTSRNANKDTALHLAVMNGCLDVIHFLTSDLNCDPTFQVSMVGLFFTMLLNLAICT